MSFILYNIYSSRPKMVLKPTALIVIVGEITSSNMYSKLKLGWAINIKIIAGVIVHTSSTVVPCVKYLYDNLLTLSLNWLNREDNIQITPNKITTRKKKILSCKSNIPVNPGEAGSCNANCQG
uniref:cytochrome c oxidase subunit 2 n=1 Tax=Auricularia villosula TaxID=1579976 RepID=UPI00207A88E0|nr:cytochrome c oxidase subunit 2 [Auricularia villosula]URP31173.1 cytochrome c oxidase subunit 2 [Auricularia villosula]